MRDSAAEARAVFAQDRQELLVRVALVEEHRLAQLHGEVELSPERCELRRARRKIAKIVQPALADRDDLRLRGEGRELLQRRLVEFARMMRMNARRATKALRIAADQLDGGARARQRAAGNHHARDADCVGAPDHVGSIAVETVVGEVDADVDELERARGESASWQPVISFGHEL